MTKLNPLILIILGVDLVDQQQQASDNKKSCMPISKIEQPKQIVSVPDSSGVSVGLKSPAQGGQGGSTINNTEGRQQKKEAQVERVNNLLYAVLLHSDKLSYLVIGRYNRWMERLKKTFR